jgi:4-hydroxybenzoate polyprenyltransferase
VVEKVIKRRWAIVWHWILSFAGILLGLYVGWKVGLNIILGLTNMFCVALLGFYSTTFKKKLLVGNVVIALLTAWVVLVVMFAEMPLFAITVRHESFAVEVDKILRVSFLYAGFAFIISLIREVVKDMEDIRGDEIHGCHTMPIVWGINVSKMFAATWLFILTASLLILLVYVMQFGWWMSAIYSLVFTIAPLVYIIRKLFTANDTRDFHHLSKWIKLVMFTGILSMFFFRVYS